MDRMGTAGQRAGDRREICTARRVALAWALAGAACQATAQVPDGPLQEMQRAAAPTRVEITASQLPQLDTPERPGFGGPRVDMTVLPGRGTLGLALGMSGLANGDRTWSATPQSAVDLGLHLRHQFDTSARLDVTAWRRVTAEPDAFTLAQQRQPTYGARVELNLSAHRGPGFVVDRGAVGLQLESGSRIVVKRSNGRPTVYYRTRF